MFFFAEPVNADLGGGQVYLLKEACVAIGSVPATDLFTAVGDKTRLGSPTHCGDGLLTRYSDGFLML